MARTTISIPDALKRRMERATARVNWSAVAAEAFAAKLDELEKQQRDMQLDAVVARLRASREAQLPSDRQRGLRAGREWVMRGADYAHLARLKRVYDWWEAEPEYGLDWFLDNVARDTGAAPSEYLAYEMLGLEPAARTVQAAVAFWTDIPGCGAGAEQVPDFLEGFVLGAVELFRQVQDALDR
jgi:hypothetical protein